MAFAYNTNAVDSLDSGPISDTNIREEYRHEWGYYWAGGRLPLYFVFDYTFEGVTEQFYAVVIHGKANTGNSSEQKEAYQRRKKAAEGLYYYLQNHKPDANIILLGDYNDDADVSIYDNSSETPYYQFVNNPESFDLITKKLSDSGQSSSVYYEEIVDHITISDELFDNHVQNSTAVYNAPQSYIENYGEMTSDHFPVWTKFDMTAPKILTAGK